MFSHLPIVEQTQVKKIFNLLADELKSELGVGLSKMAADMLACHYLSIKRHLFDENSSPSFNQNI